MTEGKCRVLLTTEDITDTLTQFKRGGKNDNGHVNLTYLIKDKFCKFRSPLKQEWQHMPQSPYKSIFQSHIAGKTNYETWEDQTHCKGTTR